MTICSIQRQTGSQQRIKISPNFVLFVSFVVSQIRLFLAAEKGFGMLRAPQHERKIAKDIKASPFVLSIVEGLRRSFSAAC